MRKMTYISVAPWSILDRPGTRVPIRLESDGTIRQLYELDQSVRPNLVYVAISVERDAHEGTDFVRRGDKLVAVCEADASQGEAPEAPLINALRRLVTVEDIPEHGDDSAVDVVDRRSR